MAAGWCATTARGSAPFRRSDGLSSDYLISLAEDRDGALWVGTLAGRPESAGPRGPRTARRALGPATFPCHHRLRRWQRRATGGSAPTAAASSTCTTASCAPTRPRRPAEQRHHLGGRRPGRQRLGGHQRRWRVPPAERPRSSSALARRSSARRCGPSRCRNDAVWFGGNGVVRYEKGVIRRFGKSDGLRSNEVRVIYALADRTWVGHLRRWAAKHRAGRPDRQLGRA